MTVKGATFGQMLPLLEGHRETVIRCAIWGMIERLANDDGGAGEEWTQATRRVCGIVGCAASIIVSVSKSPVTIGGIIEVVQPFLKNKDTIRPWLLDREKMEPLFDAVWSHTTP